MRYIYTCYIVVLFCVGFIIALPFSLVFSLFGNKRKILTGYVLAICIKVWFFLCGFIVRVVDRPKRQRGKNYIFIANHSSYLDGPMIYRCLTSPPIILASIEFSKIPLLGFPYRQATVLVDRKSLDSRRRSLIEMTKILESGKSLFIFPEGGINETGKPLKRFYDGAFSLSMHTGVSIQPVVFTDTAKRSKPDNIWQCSPGICHAIFLPEIKPNPSADTVASLRTKAFTAMQKVIEDFRKGKK